MSAHLLFAQALILDNCHYESNLEELLVAADKKNKSNQEKNPNTGESREENPRAVPGSEAPSPYQAGDAPKEGQTPQEAIDEAEPAKGIEEQSDSADDE